MRQVLLMQTDCLPLILMFITDWLSAAFNKGRRLHYSDVIMSTMASPVTSLTIVYSTVYSRTDERKLQSSASLSFVRGIHRWPVNSPHKGPVMRKIFPFDDVIMILMGLSPRHNGRFNITLDVLSWDLAKPRNPEISSRVFRSLCKQLWCRTMRLLIHLSLDNTCAISRTIFSDAFSWMKIDEFGLRFHWILFLRVQLTTFQHWFR